VKIGIIGSGNIGGTLARRLTALGHDVAVANSRGPESLSELAAETGAAPVPVAEIGQGADVVILAVPQKSILDLAPGILSTLPDAAVVIDTGNYVPQQRDGKIQEIEDGVAESRWAETHLGHPVVKAFNNILAQHLLTLGKPAGSLGRIALPVAGDYAEAKAVVIELTDQLGFDSVDAGGLDDSWRQHPGTPVFCTDLGVEGVRRALSAASPERPTQFRA
jgi:8-hydroxy-5-deazaflavin:NADPH oxidoreductase